MPSRVIIKPQAAAPSKMLALDGKTVILLNPERAFWGFLS